ncbi:type 2 isopentenyl-diphosphate Delta-isomerase [Brevibacillus migulae]|uniref:type 2 isopentenyl-diphosphate Delta-isomerase n=1 Tax=Brevibacillus migulae TaxID=1644114 RepID=UPI00106DDC6C|nr:type 2 isopentenyl-diphosphate Delta-isomerase [Brevibacillus migulae]
MSRSSRKWEHVQHALATKREKSSHFDEMIFLPNSLPNIYYGNSSLATRLACWELSSPIMINAMTGGSVETQEINQKLAIVAKEKGLAMAVGSQMAAMRDKEVEATYSIVRRENPAGIIFANLGAEASVEQAKRAVAMIEANGLQIHLNVMQELIMPEGDRDFTGYLQNVERMVKEAGVPIIVKEVGFGMSRETYQRLVDVGVRIIDVGGHGGTNFAEIENKRRDDPLHMFETWGLSTVQSLLEAGAWKRPDVDFVASGGIRHGLDVCKAIALGASAAGMAGTFLELVQTKAMEQCLEAVDHLHHQIRMTLTALGCEQLSQLRARPYTLSSELWSWAVQRGIRQGAL